MPWGEAIRLTRVLAADSSSRTCAALQGWKQPMSHEAQVLADMFDLWSDKKADPYPRPWTAPKSQAIGRGTKLTPEQFRERWKELSEAAELRRLASLPDADDLV